MVWYLPGQGERGGYVRYEVAVTGYGNLSRVYILKLSKIS